MERKTIDYGIDLGTTNSEIAVLRGTVTDIIKNNIEADITPSAVYIDKRGGMQVGQRAKNMLEHENTVDDVYTEFKRRMGLDFRYEFKTAGRFMTPEELSAEVLKSLRGDVQQRTGEDVQSAVITVPASFANNQTTATKKAGALAGFLTCPLLQEPVAAALAYGFQAEMTKEYWLVYDFGGGTFDAAVIRAEEGSISVVNHGGDNYLGGSDIDWAITDNLVVPELMKNFNLPGFERRNEKKWKAAHARVKRAVEEAKIQLSRSETANLDICNIKDADGKEIEIDLKLTRGAVVKIVEPIIMRSVDICKRVLKEKNLSANEIERVILVGGPTLASYFREILHSNLKIQLDHSVDPFTVVARGAAVFAGTQRINIKSGARATAGQFSVNLNYKPIGADKNPIVRGEIKAESGASVEGYTIEFVNQKIRWQSGKIPLKSDGRFKAELLAEKQGQNVFVIELQDLKGNKQVAVPNSLTYTIGLAITDQPITQTIAIAYQNNIEVFFKKGDPLPAKATSVFRTAHSVKKGESEDILNVPVVEGENLRADRNQLLGHLRIPGTEIRRDLPAGSEIEVTLHMDASRIILVKAYIPMLDEEFKAEINLNNSSPDQKTLKKENDIVAERVESLRDKAAEAEDSKANELLDNAAGSKDIEDIKHMIEVAKDDPVSAKQAEQRLLEMKIRLDEAEDVLKWPALITEANKEMDNLDKIIEEHGTAEQKEQAATLRDQLSELIEQKRSEPLLRKMAQIGELRCDVLFKQPGFWLGYYNHLIEQRDKMQDSATAERLINQGKVHIDRGDIPGLSSVVAQLLQLLPTEVAEIVERGYGSSLLK